MTSGAGSRGGPGGARLGARRALLQRACRAHLAWRAAKEGGSVSSAWTMCPRASRS